MATAYEEAISTSISELQRHKRSTENAGAAIAAGVAGYPLAVRN